MLDDDLLNWDWLKENRSERWPRMVCQHLAERASSTPNDIVVTVNGESLTAHELASRASSVAAALLEESHDQPVVLLVDRSLTSVAALIGVYWSGRCAIPLDVDDPIGRLTEIVERVETCTIADGSGRGPHSIGSQAVVDVSRAEPRWIEPVASRGDATALVVFTSGSTGRPKGVMRTGWHCDVSTLRRHGELAPGSRTAIFPHFTGWVGSNLCASASWSDQFR